jgi:hypothetical protein
MRKPTRPLRRVQFAVPDELPVSLCDHFVDEMLVAYVSWREECDAVHEAYARCALGEAREGRERFWAYLAALEREERAAAVYARRVDRAVNFLRSSHPG